MVSKEQLEKQVPQIDAAWQEWAKANHDQARSTAASHAAYIAAARKLKFAGFEAAIAAGGIMLNTTKPGDLPEVVFADRFPFSKLDG